MKIRNSLAAAALAASLGACAVAQDATPALPTEDDATMLTILTSADPETQLMALVLTNSAKANGETAHILLCSAAGDLALSSPPASAVAPLQPRGASPQGLLKKMMSEGVTVDVCAIYLPNRPFGPEALLDGVGVAKPDAMGKLIASPGETIMSF